MNDSNDLLLNIISHLLYAAVNRFRKEFGKCWGVYITLETKAFSFQIENPYLSGSLLLRQQLH